MLKKISLFIFVVFIFCSCVSSHVFDDAQTVGMGNQTIEASLMNGIYKPAIRANTFYAPFYNRWDIGTARINYVLGASESVDLSVGVDLPIGVYTGIKWNFREENIRHLHAMKLEVLYPVSYWIGNNVLVPDLVTNASYIYTYRYDDLLSWSINSTFTNLVSSNEMTIVPGISSGIHLGDEIRFTAGFSYFNNFGILGESPIQNMTIMASIKYDLQPRFQIQ